MEMKEYDTKRIMNITITLILVDIPLHKYKQRCNQHIVKILLPNQNSEKTRYSETLYIINT